MTSVLITGVRGKTGEPLAALLAARDGVEVRGGSSDPSKVELDGVRPTAFSWDEPGGWPAAVEGVDAVFLVRPDRADAPEIIASFVAGTPEAVHIVLLSERDDGWFDDGSWATRAERAVTESGRSWTVLRPSWFMQVLTDGRFLRDQIAGGELPFPDGGAKIAWIDARDIAAVAEQALLDRKHAGRRYELSGPRALALPEVAQLLSDGLGREIHPESLTIEEGLVGLEGFDHELTLITYERVQAGAFAGVTDDVERVTGGPARTLEEFVADYGSLLAPTAS